MGDIRGEKVSFRKQDIASLEAMPSARSGTGPLVSTPRRRSKFYIFARLLMSFIVLATLGTGVLMYAVERGIFDKMLTQQAADALNSSLGKGFVAEVGSAGIRFATSGRLALEAHDVKIAEVGSGDTLLDAGSVRLYLTPLTFLTGHIHVSSVELQDMHLDSALLPKQQTANWGDVRIDGIPELLEAFYTQLDTVAALVTSSGTRSLQIVGSQFSFQTPQNKTAVVEITALNLLHSQSDHLSAGGTVSLNGKPMQIILDAAMTKGKIAAIKLLVNNADLSPLTLVQNLPGMNFAGFSASVFLDISVRRGLDGDEKLLSVVAKARSGLIYVDGKGQELTSANVGGFYDFGKKSIELFPSEVIFGRTRLPLKGSILDVEANSASAGKGYAISIEARDGTAAPDMSGSPPIAFNVTAEGDFLPATGTLTMSKLVVDTPLGSLAGSVVVKFSGLSPEISLAAEAPVLGTDAIKQIWPYWIATKARKWALANVFDGKIKNASIAVFIPQDRMLLASGHMDLNENQLKLSFEGENLRVNVPGEMPPLRDVSGRFSLVGGSLSVDVDQGVAYLASDRKVALEKGHFAISQTYVRPLMADLDLEVSGTADALAEIASLKPVDGLKRTEFKVDDFSGNAKAHVYATFGLVPDHKPPPPVWKAELSLSNVSLAKPLAGRKITSLNGTLAIDSSAAHLDVKGKVDGVDMSIAAVEPLDKNSGIKRQLNVSGILEGKDIKILAPGLSDIVQGSVGIELSTLSEKQQKVKVDLGNAVLTVPWIGWNKGSGIAAKSEFTVQTTDGVTDVSDFSLKGDGFGLAGNLQFGKQGLSSANFSSVKLSPGDSFSLSIARKNDDYRVKVSGKAIDARPLLAKLKTSAGAQGNDKSSFLASLDVGKVTGFHDEALGNLKGEYGTVSGSLTRLSLTAVSSSGQAVVANLAADGNGKSVQLTAGDAGALARFADVYKNMQNGLLNMRLKQTGPGAWVGNIDIRKFQLSNEDRLQTIVSTPAGESGKSLNQAVKRDIDVRSEKFARGVASLTIKNGVIEIDNGVVRGEQVGATFQGTVRDANGNTDMTGTFMPAYGLNRLFAELPVIGMILGNGRDRGLIGITFKLSGPFEKPVLTINPLSLIAPGVFRSIFEFQ